jgi:quercetin dioxygenase-like cupin family protein
MKVTLLAAAALAVFALAGSATAAKPPIFAQARAVGTIVNPLTLTVKAGTMALDTITIQPGGSFGWHTHSSAVAVVVQRGTLTVLDPTIGGCSPFKVSKGAAFVEPADHIHLARNDTKKPVVVYAMYLGIPKGTQPNNPATQPSGCNS